MPRTLTPKVNRAWVGKRVRALIGVPVRYGVVVRVWHPWREAKVRWDDGSETNIDLKHLERVGMKPAALLRSAITDWRG
jgi:hypothetical protein